MPDSYSANNFERMRKTLEAVDRFFTDCARAHGGYEATSDIWSLVYRTLEAVRGAKIGNAMDMRMALEIMYDWILKAGVVAGHPDTEQKRRQLYDMMGRALAAPPRNCDVGTSLEQVERFDAYCGAHEPCDDCTRCIKEHWASHDTRCFSSWAQMPYEVPAVQKGDNNNGSM